MFAKRAEGVYDGFQRGAFASQRLGALGVIPDLGVFQFAFDFYQLFLLFSVVKGTPSASRNAVAFLECGYESG